MSFKEGNIMTMTEREMKLQ